MHSDVKRPIWRSTRVFQHNAKGNNVSGIYVFYVGVNIGSIQTVRRDRPGKTRAACVWNGNTRQTRWPVDNHRIWVGTIGGQYTFGDIQVGFSIVEVGDRR